MYCRNCARQLADNAEFCINSAASDRSKEAAIANPVGKKPYRARRSA